MSTETDIGFLLLERPAFLTMVQKIQFIWYGLISLFIRIDGINFKMAEQFLTVQESRHVGVLNSVLFDVYVAR